MRHRKSGRKLGRNAAQRHSLMRNLVSALIEHGRLQTTDAKAKELRRIADKIITLGKRGDLHARRQAAVTVQNPDLLKKLFDEVAPRFAERNGGYTRVLKLGNRQGDNAPISLVELVDYDTAEAAAEPESAE